MKTKITLFFIFLFIPLFYSQINAQTVTGTPSNTGCQNMGIITASSSGLGATPQYQLLRSGVVISPVPGDNTQFTTTAVFTGLSTGTYVINGRATSGGTVFSSSNISVTDGYTAMTVTTPTKIANCVGGTATLTSTTINGKAPFTYTIATQTAPTTILQSSGVIASRTFTFNLLAANNYIISVTDACGQTVTGATSITNPTVTVNDIKLASIAYSGRAGLSCIDPIRLYIERNFAYVINSNPVTTADASLFRWKIKYQGQFYGQDTDGDGYADLNGDGFLLSTINPIMPRVADRNGVIADISNMRVVLMDMCGNSKEFTLVNYNTTYSTFTVTNCAGTALVRSSIGAGLDCLPINAVMTNVSNPADVHNVTVTSASAQSFNVSLTPGATYNITFQDNEGYTTGLYTAASNRLTFSAVSSFTATQNNQSVASLNNLDYGTLFVTLSPILPTDILTYTVTASDNPLVPVGYSYSDVLSNYTNGSGGTPRLPSPNVTDPQPYWPKGNYTLNFTSNCGTKSLNIVVPGRSASLSGHTITSVCGGFNYVMNGTFDDPTAYQVVIVSGPSSVGQVRDLANTTASLPFNGLSYGTYVFGLRIKGGTTNVLKETITYDANNAIIVNKSNTGGYVCAPGATNGVLTIAATSNSPAPGNIMEYALSTDNGATFGAYQSNNTFSGLADGDYYFRIKDGCGNVITQSAQIGVAAAPDATANGLTSPATICNSTSGKIQLDVDISGALSYLWTGPGITASNQNEKNPLINYSDLTVGVNNFTCTITLGAPCNSNTVSSLTINVNSSPNLVINNPSAVCVPNTIDITSTAITAGSDANLTYAYFSDSSATIALADPSAIGTEDTYYIKATNTNGCSIIKPVVVNINQLPEATINYPLSPHCNIGVIPVEQTGVAGGTYSSDIGLIIDPASGEINAAASTTGLHTITYTFSDANCTNSTATTIVINPLPVASIAYANSSYCNRGTATPTETGITNGTYTSTTGLDINEVTGEINLVASTPGNYTVSYEYSNGTCSNITTTTIAINATTLPAALSDINEQCTATVAAPSLTDPCAGSITATTPTAFPITTQGTTTITWTFDYGNGFTQTLNQNIIIDDTILPVTSILADVIAECSATPSIPTALDACKGTIIGTTNINFPITAQGTTVVTWTFDDGNENISTANQNVVIKDTAAPSIPVLADVTAECSATPSIPTALDACAGTITGTTNVNFPITTQGTTVVTWTFDDGNGNISTANQNVVIKDTAAPTVPVLADVSAECSATPTIPTAIDACAGTITGTTNVNFPITTQGTTVITWTFDDGNGNISTANQNVIIKDTTAPIVPVLADVTAECSATLSIPTAIDACAGTIIGTTNVNFPITTQGTTVVIWTFDDGNGNISTASQNVIIKDVTPPVAPTLNNIIGCSVTPPIPTAIDACAGIVIATTTTVFPITAQGTTIVTWTFDDKNGNITTVDQNIIIDQIALTSPETTACSTVQAGYTITLSVTGQPPYTATGTGTPGTWSGNTWTSGLIRSGTNYNVNLNDAGNCNTVNLTGTSPNCCIFNVTCPTFQPLTVSCYDELPSATSLTEAQFEALGNGDGRIANTNCGVIEITASNGANPGCNANGIRTYTVTEYADTNSNGIHDAGENTILNSSQCTQNILIHDTTAPVFNEAMPAITINADCDTIPPAETYTATDGCGVATVTYNEQRIEGDCSSRYSLIRTWTASDQCGNQNSFVQTVNVSCVEEVYNAISANGDGLNDSLFIKGIDCYPNNIVKIYNRYGVVVYEKNGYDNITTPFEGFSDGRATVARGNKLPTGTYFYTLEYDSNGRKIKKAGYLYVNSQ